MERDIELPDGVGERDMAFNSVGVREECGRCEATISLPWSLALPDSPGYYSASTAKVYELNPLVLPSELGENRHS